MRSREAAVGSPPRYRGGRCAAPRGQSSLAAEAPVGYAAEPAGAGEAHRLLGEIEQRLAQLAALPLDTEADGDQALVGSVEALQRIETRTHAEKLRRVAAVERRGAQRVRGARTTTDLLAGLGLTRRDAKAQAHTATALRDLPETAGRLAAGDLDAGQARTAARALADLAAGHDPEAGEALDEAAAELDRLVATADARDAAELRRRLDEWQHQRGGGQLAERERRAWQLRRLTVRVDASDGTAVVSGRLDPIGGATLRAALDALSRPDGAEDTRDHGQRQADALVDLAGRALDAGSLPEVAAQRPHVLLVTTPDALHDRPGAPPSVLDGHGPVSSATARQICCDADLTPVTTDTAGDVLNLGRRRRDPNRYQRSAVIARDRRCVGCGAAASRCQVHHIDWWDQGGPTDLANLCLLCWNCHHHVHHYDWQVNRRPDGGYTAGPPPPRARVRLRDTA